MHKKITSKNKRSSQYQQTKSELCGTDVGGLIQTNGQREDHLDIPSIPMSQNASVYELLMSNNFLRHFFEALDFKIN